MPYIPFPAAPLVWTMRLVKGSTLTHKELDDNQKALNQKINDRNNARKKGDYNLADTIRKELENSGVIIEDKQDKTNWKYK